VRTHSIEKYVLGWVVRNSRKIIILTNSNASISNLPFLDKIIKFFIFKLYWTILEITKVDEK